MIKLERGCRQGCSVSPLSFALFLEPLSQWIKQNNGVKGVVMAGGEQKIAMFADDVLIYLVNPNSSLPILMGAFKEFGMTSGYKVNVQKTLVMTLTINQTQLSAQVGYEIYEVLGYSYTKRAWKIEVLKL